MKKLQGGLWPVMLTPFQDNGDLDLEGLETLTMFYMNSGASGLFANCLSGEMYELSENERLLVIKKVVDSTKNKIPVVATGTFSKDLMINKNFVNKVYDLGVEAVIINTNQLNGQEENETEFKNKLEELISTTENIPLGIYECPEPFKRLLSPDLLKWMGESGRFLYHKDTSCDLLSIEKKIEAIKGTSLQLYNAHTPTGLESLKKGAGGLSPIGANFFPEVYQFLIKNYSNGEKTEEINKLNSLLISVDPLIHCFYPYSAKYILKKRGLRIGNKIRTVISKMTSQDFLKFEEIFFAFEKMVDVFGIKKII